MIRITCPCACVWRVDYKLAGKQIPCPICGRIVSVPGKIRGTGGEKEPAKAGESQPALIWYIQTDDGELGPIHIVQIAKAAWMGKINRNTKLRRSGTDEIVAAGDLEGIFPDKPAAKSKKAAAPGGVTDELSDYLSGLAKQAGKKAGKQGEASPAEIKSGGSLGALLDAQRDIADAPAEADQKAPPKSRQGKAAKKKAEKKKSPPPPEKKASKAASRPELDLEALANALSAEAAKKEPEPEAEAKPAGKVKTKAKKKKEKKKKKKKKAPPKKEAAEPETPKKAPPKEPPAKKEAAPQKEPAPPKEAAPPPKPTSEAAARRAALKALADTLSAEERPDLEQIEAAGLVQTQVYEGSSDNLSGDSSAKSGAAAEAESTGQLRLKELQKVPRDRSAAMARIMAHWERLAAAALSPEFFAKTSTIIFGTAMLLTIVIPWGLKDKSFVMSWEILQEAGAGPVLLLVGTWVVALAVVLAGALVRKLTLSVSGLALGVIALVMVLLSGEGMQQLAPWLATVKPLVRKVVPGAAGLLLMVVMAATRLRLRGDESVAPRLAQRLGGGGMAILAATAVILLILDYTGLEKGPRKDLFFDFLFFLMLWICLLITGVLADTQTILRAGGPTCGKVSLWVGYAAVLVTMGYVIVRPAQKSGPLAAALSGVNLCLLVAAPWWLAKLSLEKTVRGLTERLAASAEGNDHS